MPLSPPTAARRHLHTRQVICQGFRRDDGLWDIEGQITDTKTYDLANHDRGGCVRAGEAVHHMRVRVTIDEAMLIHAAEAAIDYAPFTVCANIAPDFSGLVGLTLGPGFRKSLMAKFGGIHGCTHVVELMGPIATTAYQTLAVKGPPKGAGAKPAAIDRCHALAADGPVVARLWPAYAAAKTGEE